MDKTSIRPQVIAMEVVYNYVSARLDKTNLRARFDFDDIYVTWFCKTLQNWKALITTTLPDGMYYEVSYDGEKEKIYLDAYKKFENISTDINAHGTI